MDPSPSASLRVGISEKELALGTLEEDANSRSLHLHLNRQPRRLRRSRRAPAALVGNSQAGGKSSSRPQGRNRHLDLVGADRNHRWRTYPQTRQDAGLAQGGGKRRSDSRTAAAAGPRGTTATTINY